MSRFGASRTFFRHDINEQGMGPGLNSSLAFQEGVHHKTGLGNQRELLLGWLVVYQRSKVEHNSLFRNRLTIDVIDGA